MTSIQWTDATWNPIVGCSIVSPGCTNCYAMKAAWRMSKNPATPQYHGTVDKVNGKPVWNGTVRLVESKLAEPLRRRKPTMWFVNSMSDLFHEDIPDEWIDRVFAVMALCPQHIFQVLTKRSKRLRDYATKLHDEPHQETVKRMAAAMPPSPWPSFDEITIPLPNVWCGVSAERQKEADERIPDLLATPAAVRFVSAEPLLERIDLVNLALPGTRRTLDALTGLDSKGVAHFDHGLDQVIVGGESGPSARECDIANVRLIVRQCEHDTYCFVKQLGAKVYSTDSAGKYRLLFDDKKGGDMSEWPEDLRVREYPNMEAVA